MAIVQSAEALIGKTPLLRLNRLFPNMDIYAKLEYLNPAGSAKDRAARSMLDDLEARGLLKPGGTVVEPTSGNTGAVSYTHLYANHFLLAVALPAGHERSAGHKRGICTKRRWRARGG